MGTVHTWRQRHSIFEFSDHVLLSSMSSYIGTLLFVIRNHWHTCLWDPNFCVVGCWHTVLEVIGGRYYKLLHEVEWGIIFIHPRERYPRALARGYLFLRVNKNDTPWHLSGVMILSYNKKPLNSKKYCNILSNHESYLDLLHFFLCWHLEGQLTKWRPLIG